MHKLLGRLKIPALAAPMFLVSGPELVIAACRGGILGTFPALNQRTPGGFEDWLKQIRAALTSDDAPFGANLAVHATSPRAGADLAAIVRYQVPVVVTTLGLTREVADAVHSYGGLVLHDAITVRHAQKAVAVGADGVIAVCAGAGGHAGTYNPFAFAAELLPYLEGKLLILSGGISTGAAIAGAIAAGADMAALGTRFIATHESLAQDEYKRMICESAAKDIVYTDVISGLPASFLRARLEAFGVDRTTKERPAFSVEGEIEPKLWRDFWSAGQSAGGINDIIGVTELCARLAKEYHAAASRLAIRAARG